MAKCNKNINISIVAFSALLFSLVVMKPAFSNSTAASTIKSDNTIEITDEDSVKRSYRCGYVIEVKVNHAGGSLFSFGLTPDATTISYNSEMLTYDNKIQYDALMKAFLSRTKVCYQTSNVAIGERRIIVTNQ